MRAGACVSCWLLLAAAAVMNCGVRAFGPMSSSSTVLQADGAVMAQRCGGSSGSIFVAPRCRGGSSTRTQRSSSSSKEPAADAAAARLRDVTMRMYTAPTRTVWGAPSKTAAAAANLAASITAAAGGAPATEKKTGSSGGGSTVLDRPAPLASPKTAAEQPSPVDKFKVMLFNDSGNTREYVARVLVQVVGMPEGDAYEIMTMAHKNGMALVGIWHLELAEAYSDTLKARGLISEVFPVE